MQRHGGDEAYLIELHAEGNRSACPLKGIGRHVAVPEAKVLKGVGQTVGVVCRGKNQNIEVHCETRMPVEGDGMAAADGVVDLVTVEQVRGLHHAAGDGTGWIQGGESTKWRSGERGAVISVQ